MLISIVIRTFNESEYLGELLEAIQCQQKNNFDVEVILVDSGSTDSTVEIAESFSCRIIFIKKEDFTFGRSLNMGCEAADGDVLVFISGHCIPENERWLEYLVTPLINGVSVYSYGKQIGNEVSKFSEHQVFSKYFPEESSVPQKGFFCNNANAALLKLAWCDIPFCEELTGLEDMHLAKKLVERGDKIAYVAEAPVYHIHNERWRQIKRRYEREAIALQAIMPEVHISFYDFMRYFFSAIVHDLKIAKRQGEAVKRMKEIILFRFMHFWGAYKGNHQHKILSAKAKDKYFFPKN